MRAWSVVALLLLACGRTDPFDTTCGPNTVESNGVCVANQICGPGTHLVGSECLPGDAGSDAAADGSSDAHPDWVRTSHADGEATSFAIDPAHDNVLPNDVVAAPLSSRWSTSLDGQPGYPIVVANEVIFSTLEGEPNLRALDLESGELLWGPFVFGSMPLIASDMGRVYVVGVHGELAALDVQTGKQLWTSQIPFQPYIYGPPIAISGVLYVNATGGGGTTYAIDGATGQTIWSNFTADGSDGAPAFRDNVIYDAEACQELYAFDALNGTLLFDHKTNCTGIGTAAPSVYGNMIWERDFLKGGVIIDTQGNNVGAFKSDVAPAIHAGLAFYVSNGALTAVEVATSKIKWSFSGGGYDLCTSPVVAGAGGQVFVASSAGKVYEVDELTGVEHSSASPGDVACGTESIAITLGLGHLLIPLQKGLVVY